MKKFIKDFTPDILLSLFVLACLTAIIYCAVVTTNNQMDSLFSGVLFGR